MSRIEPESGHMAWSLPDTAQCSGAYSGCFGRGEWQLDPYEYAINDHKIRRYLCEHCVQERRDDI